MLYGTKLTPLVWRGSPLLLIPSLLLLVEAQCRFASSQRTHKRFKKAAEISISHWLRMPVIDKEVIM